METGERKWLSWNSVFSCRENVFSYLEELILLGPSDEDTHWAGKNLAKNFVVQHASN